MTNKFYVLILLFCAIFMSGCSSVQKRQNAAVSAAVYSTKASMDAGRFDLAKKYNDEAVRLIPPPKKAVKINAFDVKKPTSTEKATSKWNTSGIFSKDDLGEQDTERYVVLPPGFENKKVIVADSVEYNKLLADNEYLRKREVENNAKIIKLQSDTDKILIDKQKELEKAQKKGFWAKLFGWTLGLGGLGIIGVIVACVFFPPLIPFVFTIFGNLVSGASSVITGITNLIRRKPPA